MARGKIKKLIRDKGFGFIEVANSKDVFFHQSGLLEGDFNSLNEGQEVEFEIEQSPKGPRAVQVKAV